MMDFPKFSVVFLAVLCKLGYSLAVGKPWPIVPWPQSATWGDTTGLTTVSPDLKLVINGPDPARSVLQRAWSHVRSTIFLRDWSDDMLFWREKDSGGQQPSDRQPLESIVVNFTSTEWMIGADTNETYHLEVPLNENSVRAHATTIFGALRALQTFSLMVEYDMSLGLRAGAGTYVVRGAPIIVNDWPRFQHRGLLVDTGRHYVSVAILRQLIRSMSVAKLNVLHWHAVDDESFPLQFESPSIPPLDRGAFTPAERYTPADVQGVVEYAMLHGVRVVMELDTPGHTASWCVGDDAICPSKSCSQPLNPATPKTFELMANMFSELRKNLPDSFLHLGADEVDFTCWTEVPSIEKWMNTSHFTPKQAYLYFIQRLMDIAKDQKFESIVWDSTVWSMFGSSLPKPLIIHVTYSTNVINDVTAAGYRVIFSQNHGYYLNQVDLTWKDTYESDPLEKISKESQAKLVLGGEVTMWGEDIDASNLLLTVWPRTAAGAERFWSSRSMNSLDEFLPRLHRFRCRLLELGFPTAPVMNLVARSMPIGPGSCSWQ